MGEYDEIRLTSKRGLALLLIGGAIFGFAWIVGGVLAPICFYGGGLLTLIGLAMFLSPMVDG